MTEFAAIPAITILCLGLGKTFKALAGEDLWKHIPVLCGVFGCALGIICHLAVPGYIPADNLLVAAATGLVSGWAATGVHQVVKQELGEYHG